MKSHNKFRILGMILISILIVVYFIFSSFRLFNERQLGIVVWAIGSIISIGVSGLSFYFEKEKKIQEFLRFAFMITLVILSYFDIVLNNHLVK